MFWERFVLQQIAIIKNVILNYRKKYPLFIV